jgi:hypothetical protein
MRTPGRYRPRKPSAGARAPGGWPAKRPGHVLEFVGGQASGARRRFFLRRRGGSRSPRATRVVSVDGVPFAPGSSGRAAAALSVSCKGWMQVSRERRTMRIRAASRRAASARSLRRMETTRGSNSPILFSSTLYPQGITDRRSGPPRRLKATVPAPIQVSRNRQR